MRDNFEPVQPTWETIDPHGADFADSFGRFLVEAGAIERSTLERARGAMQRTRERFDHVLVKLGLLSEPDLATTLARYLRLPLWDAAKQSGAPLLPDLLPATFLRRNRVLPVAIEGSRLRLAVVDPFDTLPIHSIGHATELLVQPELLTPADFEKSVKAIYPSEAQGAARVGGEDDEPREFDLQRLRDSASGAPVIRLVNQIIAQAIDARASDIHVESMQDALVVRYRVDGVLRVVDTIPARLRAAVISRFKILAKLDIAERRLPLDGRLKLAFRGSEIDFRVATIPTFHGESVVIRVLDRTLVSLDFEALGFTPEQTGQLSELMTQPNGMLVVTGPTGSGKTTTLYTMMKQVNNPEVKIFTVEDPVEYMLDGINQVQVQPDIGLDFPTVLRSILRHNPNLIMIGEVRDAATASIAVQASLTGHLVFCTLHTNSAAATIGRLMDMGVEHFLLGSVVKGIVAQRLVRRLCTQCSRPHPRARVLALEMTARMPSLSIEAPANIRECVGCAECGRTGYIGRLTIVEIMIVDERLQEGILARKNAVELAALAHGGGMRTMHEDGLLKAWRGLTTLDELVGVTDGDTPGGTGH